MDDEDWQERWDDEPDFFRSRSGYDDDTTLEGAMNYHLTSASGASEANPDTGAVSEDPDKGNSFLSSAMSPSGQQVMKGQAMTKPLVLTQIAKGESGPNPAPVKPIRKSKPTEIQADIDLDEVDFGNVKFLSGQELIDFYRTHKVYSAYPELLDPTLNDKDRKKLGHDIRKRISAQDIRNKKRNRMDELEKKLKEYEAQEKLAYQEEIRLLKERNEKLESILKAALMAGSLGS